MRTCEIECETLPQGSNVYESNTETLKSAMSMTHFLLAETVCQTVHPSKVTSLFSIRCTLFVTDPRTDQFRQN